MSGLPLFDYMTARQKQDATAAQAMGVKAIRIKGAAFDKQLDHDRLRGQQLRIFKAVTDGHFRTLAEIASVTGDHEASISAVLRALTDPKVSPHKREKRRRGNLKSGLWEYRIVIVNQVETV